MKSVQITDPGRIEIKEIPIPKPGPRDVLLKVNYLGLCGSDMKTFQGSNPLVEFPRIPGHEISGKVIEAGSDLNGKIEKNSVVTVSPYTSCGFCSACRQGKLNCCRYNQTLGVQRDGAAAEYIAVPFEKVIVPGDIDEKTVSLIEPLSVGFHAANRIPGESSENVLVFGCGLVGLGAIAGAAERRMKVIAVDIDDAKLQLSSDYGAVETLNADDPRFNQHILDLTGGEGPDAVIEAVGIADTFKRAVDLVNFGGCVVYIGYVKEPVSYETKEFVRKELSIFGSRNALPADFKNVIELMNSRKMDFSRLITKTFRLEEAEEAFLFWDTHKSEVFKILLTTYAE